MLPGYNRAFNGFALKCMKFVPEIPDHALGVGAAEVLQAVPVVIHYDPNPNPWGHITQEALNSTRNVQPKLQDMQVKWKDFPNEGWMGSPFGGFN